MRRRPRRRALSRISGAPRDGERGRFRRPAAAQSDAVRRRIRTSLPTTSGGSGICWSTNTRTPTSRSICGCGCWRSSTSNLCCVGDDDQSIYGWRGAEIGNILRFERDFPGAPIVRLEQNYRSTPPILGAAGGIIAQNRGRLGKTLWTQAGEGEKIVVRGLWDAEQEARWVGDEIEALQRKGHALARLRSSSAPASRPANSRSASSPWRCPTASSAGRASTSARKSATRSPICGWSISPPTTSPSSAS